MNIFQYLIFATAIAQAIESQRNQSIPNPNKRANAIKAVLAAVTPFLHGTAATPQLSEHIGALIDDFVQLGKHPLPAVPAAPAQP